MIKVKCVVCGKTFRKSKKAYDRTVDKHDCNHACSSKCAGSVNHEYDEFSPFVRHKFQAKRRADKKDIEFDLTLEDLKSQWDKQKGICPYTGWELTNRNHSRETIDITLDRASLDRKDSQKGYTKDNIQFCSFAAQNAKHNFKEKDFLRLIKAIAQYKELLNG